MTRDIFRRLPLNAVLSTLSPIPAVRHDSPLASPRQAICRGRASRPALVFRVLSLAMVIVCGTSVPTAAHATPNISIETVPIGNAGNTPDNRGRGPVGAVDYEYRIGKYEVTNAQYAAFLNAKAAIGDPLGLYSPSAIIRIGNGTEDDPYTYGVDVTWANKPVDHASWYDAIRFVNWLHNGQGNGDTETGAYTLGPIRDNGIPLFPNSITRNAGATWWLPNRDEWYKAAFYDPTLSNDAGGYWDYPTGSNIAPIAEAPPGGANSANFGNIGIGYTDVGAYIDSPSPYGTFDQGGSVWEWTDTRTSTTSRALAGGSWFEGSEFLSASIFAVNGGLSITRGFRVATVPEPSSLVLTSVGGIAMAGLALRQRKRRK